MAGEAVDSEHSRPDGVNDKTVEAVGKLSEAMECVERARGRLYDLHQLIGHADLMLDDAVALFTEAGHDDVAERLVKDLVGRNVIGGRWTFQIVEDFDDNYRDVFRDHVRRTEADLLEGRRHVYEAEMKQQRRTHGRPGHEATPADV